MSRNDREWAFTLVEILIVNLINGTLLAVTVSNFTIRFGERNNKPGRNISFLGLIMWKGLFESHKRH